MSAEISRSTQYGDLPEWLTPTEAAAYLGVTTWFIYQRIHHREMPHRRVGPKIIKIPRTYFHPDNAVLHEAQSAHEVVAPRVSPVAPKPPERRLTAAKRRALVREVAKDLLRETLDRVRAIERSSQEQARPQQKTEAAL